MADIIRRFHAGDPSAFGELITEEQDDIYTLCLRCVGPGDAEALCETIFIAAHQALHRLAPETNPHQWMMRLGVDHIEAHTIRDEGTEDALHDRSATTQELLNLLDMPFRIAVVMRDILRMSEEQISDTLDLPLGTTRSRIHRARLTMARGLSPKLDRV
jgi:RNA polymerase sigma-70 factor (ECF subfamily)